MNSRLAVSITLSLILSGSSVMAGSTTLVSTKSQKNQSNGASSDPSVSDTGDFIAFVSVANNLAARCNNGANQIFVRDQTAGTITCVSVNSDGKQGDQDSHAPSISSDGRFIAFDSAATNLTGGKCDNGLNHIFVRDRSAGTTICVSVHSNGTEGNGDSFEPSISSDGHRVVFHSSATNLTTRCTNGNFHVYLHDLTTGQTRCLSVDSNGDQGDGNSDLPRISGDGLFVAFESNGTNLTSRCNNAFTQIFVRDLTNDKTSCASVDNHGNQGNNDSIQPSISSDGQSVAYSSVATNLSTTRCITGNSQVFVRDRSATKTTCVSVDSKKKEGNGGSVTPSISGNGSQVAFESISNNLVKKDKNGILDVFVHSLPY
ncbi:MAG: TolB family protein [Alphaproteobacteria bacterium]